MIKFTAQFIAQEWTFQFGFGPESQCKPKNQTNRKTAKSQSQ